MVALRSGGHTKADRCSPLGENFNGVPAGRVMGSPFSLSAAAPYERERAGAARRGGYENNKGVLTLGGRSFMNC